MYRYVIVCVAVEIHIVGREAGEQAIITRLDDALVLRDMDVSACFAALVFEGGRTFCEAAGTDARMYSSVSFYLCVLVLCACPLFIFPLCRPRWWRATQPDMA